jgi:hypothetical protein
MISVETWLKSFGLRRNPFETTEAGGEAHYAVDFLHETFVKPQGFDEILGHPSHPKSSIVFAARGKGKTSARLMTAHFCREGIFPKETNADESGIVRVLPVHHTRFERIIGASSMSDLVDAHVIEILFRAVPALVEMLSHYPELAESINKLDILRRLELQYFLVAFKSHVPFQEYKTARDLLGKEIVSLGSADTPMGFSLPASSQPKTGLAIQEIVSHLGAYSQMPPIDLLGRFTALLAELGFAAVYVLVDGLDEIPETADNFVVAAGLLIPLLANLNLMTNTPYLVFKIFVPSEMEPLLLEATRKIRRDRLAVQRMELRDDDLVEILHRRLAYCSDGGITSMDAIGSVEVRGQIEKEMVISAAENPRHLVLLGQNMLEHRCQVVNLEEPQEAYLLNSDDLAWAIRVLFWEPTRPSIKNTSNEGIVGPQPDLSSQSVISPSNNWFRHEFPAPIALAYLVYQRESTAHIRIWKLYELVEASLAFLSQVLLALLHQQLVENTASQLKKNGLRLEHTSMGVWRTTLERVPGMLSGLGIRSTLSRTCQHFVNENLEFIRAINEERNRSAHGGPQTEEKCQALVEQYDGPLHQYLEAAEFLRGSRLVKVLQMQKHDGQYFHRCIYYTGDAMVFPTLNINLSAPLDSGFLWFLGDDSPINVHPLIVAIPGGSLGELVWLYQSVEKDTVAYKSYGTGQTINSGEYRKELSLLLGE